jgi:lysine-N-methylase
MPLPVRSLPVLQNWDCHSCGDCCRTYAVGVSDDERRRIEGQGWDADPALKGVELFTCGRDGGSQLAHRADDDGCVFLGADGRCRIHAKFGAAAKPIACRVYPFVMVPAGDHWRVGLRYGCPSAAAGDGRPMAAQAGDAGTYAGLLEGGRPLPADRPPPPLQPGQAVPWGDLVRIAGVLGRAVSADGVPMERKLRQALALAKVCRQARFDAVTGPRLTEFLDLMAAATADETPADPASAGRPGWAGRVVFRQVVALYARKDVGFRRGEMASRGALGRAAAAWRFATGRGRLPRVHSLIPEGTTFADGELPAGPLPAEAEALLTRYYRTKLDSLQFCGRPNFDLPFWDGFDALVLTFPAVMWLARVLSAGGRPRAEAVRLAVQVVDDNFGFNPLLGTGKQKWAVRTLGLKGELPRLVAWYGR